jgi:hypothetical protein
MNQKSVTKVVLFVAAASTVAMIGVAPVVAAPPGCTAENQNCAIVPGMQDGVLGQPCPSFTEFTFGFSSTGGVIMCAGLPGAQFGTWFGPSVQLVGVRSTGDTCTGGQMAQAPDGRPLRCGTTGWGLPGTFFSAGGNFGA